jgi:GntR family transcriptional regulator
MSLPGKPLLSSQQPSSFFTTKPLYLQVRDALLERITNNEWKSGLSIPSETDLAREMGVSLGTMRKAFDVLAKEQVVTRRQGRGTFVNSQTSDAYSLRYSNIRGPNGERLIGDVKSSKVTKSAANEMECERLSLQKEDKVYRIQRVRLTDGTPFMLEEVSVPEGLFPGLEKRVSIPNCVGNLAQEYSIVLGTAAERISVASVSQDFAPTLMVAPGSPVAVLDRVVRAIDSRPVEWRMAWCNLAKNYYLACIA